MRKEREKRESKKKRWKTGSYAASCRKRFYDSSYSFSSTSIKKRGKNKQTKIHLYEKRKGSDGDGVAVAVFLCSSGSLVLPFCKVCVAS